MTRRPVWIERLGLGLLVAAVAVALWPIEVRVASRAPALGAAPGPAERAEDAMPRDSAPRDAIVRFNLFSSSRRAPRDRFVIPGLTPAVAATDSLPGGAVGPDGVPLGSGLSEPTVVGILRLPERAQALILFPTLDSIPRLVRVGDRLTSFRVEAILADRVVLISPAGRRVLRLARRSPSDSTGMQP